MSRKISSLGKRFAAFLPVPVAATLFGSCTGVPGGRRSVPLSGVLSGLLFGTVLSVVSQSVHASDFGCEVLLCLANPTGPLAVAECVPPIRKLYSDLARGRAFPGCSMASGPAGRSYARQNWTHYDMCPDGTDALAAGAHAVPSDGARYGQARTGIGSGDDVVPTSPFNFFRFPQKICVGKPTGRTTRVWSNITYRYVQAGVYDTVTELGARWSARAIDVFIDDRLYRRVRW